MTAHCADATKNARKPVQDLYALSGVRQKGPRSWKDNGNKDLVLASGNSPPWSRRGGRDLKKMSRSHRTGADGAVQLPINPWLEQTAPSAPGYGGFASFLITGASAPP